MKELHICKLVTKKKVLICLLICVAIVLSVIVTVCCINYKKENNDVIRMSIGDGMVTYFTLKKDGKVTIERGICKNNEHTLTHNLNKEVKFEKATRLGVEYIYVEYMPSPPEVIVDEFTQLAEEAFRYSTNDYSLVTDVAPVTLWYKGKQIQRSNHSRLPTDMKKILERFKEISPIPIYLPAA